jgi:Eco57I restriction-modification methylase/TaqI-like C-terminal specificity domain
VAQHKFGGQRSPWQQDHLPLAPTTQADTATATVEERGAIFTRPEVVEFMLDLVGYRVDQPLEQLRLLEPSIGQGDFLLPAIDRLLTAWRNGPDQDDIAVLRDAIRGVELHQDTFAHTRQLVIDRLLQHGIPINAAEQLADTWLIAGDFLLAELPGRFDVVIGNPPYVRQERIPDALMAEYRARYRTIYDRADLYVPFIERSLLLLEEGGQLGFICADRWMKNRYGGPLRALVAERFHLKVYVNMVDTPAFQSDVIAYPAITIIAREPGTATRIAYRPEVSAEALTALAALLTTDHLPPGAQNVRAVKGVAAGAEPWILEAPDQLALVRRLEASFPALEEAGCKVGIGVATGADQAFIGPYDAMDVEDDRKLRLAMTRDIVTGEVRWRGLGVINPFADDGGLVPLEQYPRLRAYLEVRREAIARRHVAQKAPTGWYRTIDRITPSLATRPKLLIPDIKGGAHIVYEPGELYPHHNLYYIVSDTWDLWALQAVLRSGIARLFVATYSTRMRGGFLRFQAQYLRRIRLPHWHEVSPALRQALIAAGKCSDLEAGWQAVAALYGLSEAEQAALDERVGVPNGA